MAIRKPAAAAETAVPAADADLEQIVSDLTRVFARMAVKSSVGLGAATFRQIVVNDLHIATHDEAERIERWLSEHP